MSAIKDDAIVLRRLDYSETSQVLAIFTRGHGQQRLIAKGVKRPTRSRPSIGIDLLESGSVVFADRSGRDRGLAVLTGWQQFDHFPALRRDLPSLYAGQYAAELTAQFTEEGDPHPELFDALHLLLARLGTCERVTGGRARPGDHSPACTVLPLVWIAQFVWVLLRETGLRPEMERCSACGSATQRDRLLYFSARQGGVVCRDCEAALMEKRPVSRSAIAFLLTYGREGDALAAFDLLDYHVTELMGKRPRTGGLLRGQFEKRGHRLRPHEG